MGVGWRRFESVIEKAKDACKTASGDVLSNFADVGKIVKTGAAEKERDRRSLFVAFAGEK